MEVLRVGLDGLVAPLESRGQEPREREHHPPDAGGHAEEVEHHEQDRAHLVLGALRHGAHSLEALLGRERFAARNPVPGHEPHCVGQGYHQVAEREEDDGPLGVAEAVGVDEERADREQATRGAQDGPRADPDAGKLALLVVEEH